MVCLLLVSFLAEASFASYGARPLGMGGAYTALSDDANSAYWNPAGFALNPGVDFSGSLLINNRNDQIGDNIAALKMCLETELNPFFWILGVGVVSLAALEGAKYLHDKGVVQKGWGRDTEKVSMEESLREQVLGKGEEKTVAIGQKVKETAKEVAKESLGVITGAAKEAVKKTTVNVYWGPWNYPWYNRNYYHPSYWDYRNEEKEYTYEGKAQFAAGFTLMTDKNPVKGQDSNFYTLSLATGYEEKVALGGNLRFYDVGIYTPSGGRIKGYGAGFDLGMLLRPVDQVAFGAVAKEILTTDIRFENGAILSPKMSINTGVAITPIDELTLAADIHNVFKQSGDPQTTHLGVEARPFPGLALRAGLNDNNKCAGAAFMIFNFVVDYAYLGGAFNRTQVLGLTWKF